MAQLSRLPQEWTDEPAGAPHRGPNGSDSANNVHGGILSGWRPPDSNTPRTGLFAGRPCPIIPWVW
jgi:hypothetical protein